ncbi:hypothetical protein MTR_2g086830 [Medicago truncatula]|uniref:Uncharacterized protein n=1 Tax=Medicago truncatula TaxID=3880 RepID=G7IHG6_MEDTR|nr:hypothetical protein MTR_2g086830 [Medicago truncatula]
MGEFSLEDTRHKRVHGEFRRFNRIRGTWSTTIGAEADFVQLSYDPSMKFHVYVVLIHDIKELIAQANVIVCHTLHERNQCPDFMVKLGASSNIEFLLYGSPLNDLLHLLKIDANETFFSRERKERLRRGREGKGGKGERRENLPLVWELKNDHARHTWIWIYPMKSKFESGQLLQHFVSLVKTQYSTTIKNCPSYYASVCIIHLTSYIEAVSKTQ